MAAETREKNLKVVVTYMKRNYLTSSCSHDFKAAFVREWRCRSWRKYFLLLQLVSTKQGGDQKRPPRYHTGHDDVMADDAGRQVAQHGS